MTCENKCGIIFLYNGEYGVSTDENGLYYMRARYYNPEIKRFINQDVLTGSITDSPTLNRYAYVEGNPISLADPFGLSPAINWHSALGWLGLLTFVPGCQAIGIAANAINACLYFKEKRYFEAICSGLAALPGLGGAAGKICSASGFSNAAMMIQKGTQIASNVGFMGTGFYTIGKMGYENYQKYVERGEDFSFWDLVGDTVNGAFAVLSIYGGAKGLGFDKIDVPTKVKGAVDFSWISGKKGKLTIVEGGNYSNSELNAAQYVADQGHDVTLRPPVGTRADGGTSDLLVDGITYDVYTPETANPNAIIRAISKKNTQATGIVLDLSNTTVTEAELGNILARVNGAIEKRGGICNINDIIVMPK